MAENATNPEKFAALLADDSKWKLVPGVPVFDAHVENYSVKGADGKPQPVTENFDVARLQQIADRCNALVASGNPIGLTVGHTSDGGPETSQPETIGYAMNYRVANHPILGRPCIFHDERFYPEKYELAKTLPFRSVERWRPTAESPGDYFKPVALLRREPRRQLGAVAYAKPSGTVVRYSMEQYAMAEEKETVEEKGPPEKPEGAAPPAAEMPAAPPAPAAPAPAAPMPPAAAPAPQSLEPSDQDKQLFAAMCKYFKVQYADPTAAAPPMPGGAPAPAPMGAAPAPVQNAMAMPGASNTCPPQLNKEPAKMSADTNAVERYAAEINTLNARIAELEKGERLARYSADLRGMRELEGYDIDPAEELVRVQDYDQARFDDHKGLIRKYGKPQQLPVGPGVRPDGSPRPEQYARKGAPARIETKEQMDAALKYAAENPGKTFTEARAHVLNGSGPVR